MSKREPTPARDRTPYATRRFKEYKAWLRREYVVCWVHDEEGKCYRRATIPDHNPPVSHVADGREWRGELLPMCEYHSRRQSGKLRHKRILVPPSRQW